jgi:Zn-dependent peptidase ImmA (M78 family)/DNA-binding transcriptional regulator YiaG
MTPLGKSISLSAENDKLNPERVDLVRRRLGLSKIEFAAAISVDRKTLHRFEIGEYELNTLAIKKLIALSGYPETFFKKGTPEFPGADGVSFRSLRALTARPRDAALAASAISFELDDWIHVRFDLPSHDLPQLDGYTPCEAAAALRAHWAVGNRPITNMVNILEAHGVRVFSLAEETSYLDAYSFWRNDKPYVFLNTRKTAEHSRFDAAHELAHLVLHRHGGSRHRSAEDEANSFASEFLMPSADLVANVPFVRSIDDLIKAKVRWGVSVAALNYALHRIGIISDWKYRGFYIELNRLGRDKEPAPMAHETSQIWIKVLTALWRDGISLGHIATELAVPERELSNLLFNIASPPRSGMEGQRQPLRLVS